MASVHRKDHTTSSPSPSSSSSSSSSTQAAHPASGSASSYLSSSMTSAVSGLLRRFSSLDSGSAPRNAAAAAPSSPFASNVYTPRRTASPFQPPPLYPISLQGYAANTAPSAQLLSRAVAEEIRLLVPPRLQLCEDWHLLYSLDRDGVSLATLYKNAEDYHGLRNGFVLVVKDGDGGLFGAYMTDAPRPSPHYFGTGECFLWRAYVLSVQQALLNLPAPPSADTTNMQRSTTVAGGSSSSSLAPPTGASTGSTTPERIRFKAFPYSGINDYLMLCDADYISVGGGDGHYGLWLDDSFERGISSACPTFGNEPLSDTGQKFDVIGVELWTIGN